LRVFNFGKLTQIIHFCRTLDDNVGEIAIKYSIEKMLHSRLSVSKYTVVEITELKKPQPKEFIQTINTHDLCVIGGGGLYSHYFLPFQPEVVEAIQIPIVLYGVGYIRNFGDEELRESQLESVQLLNTHAELSSVRDEFTSKFLRRLGVRDVEVIGDPAIFLPPAESNRVDFDEDKIKIGINVACHFWSLYPQCLRRAIEAYVKACDYFVKHLDAEIVYLKHHPDEVLAAEQITKKVPIKLASTGLDPHEMKSLYTKLDLVIGMMMHSTIFAFGSEVPMVNVAYDFKNLNFMEFIGQEDRVIDVRKVNAERIRELAIKALDSSVAIKRDFATLKEKLWRAQQKFLKRIERLH